MEYSLVYWRKLQPEVPRLPQPTVLYLPAGVAAKGDDPVLCLTEGNHGMDLTLARAVADVLPLGIESYWLHGAKRSGLGAKGDCFKGLFLGRWRSFCGLVLHSQGTLQNMGGTSSSASGSVCKGCPSLWPALAPRPWGSTCAPGERRSTSSISRGRPGVFSSSIW